MFQALGEALPASLLQLPGLVETFKTADHSLYFKSGDVSHMLLVHDIPLNKAGEAANGGASRPAASGAAPGHGAAPNGVASSSASGHGSGAAAADAEFGFLSGLAAPTAVAAAPPSASQPPAQPQSHTATVAMSPAALAAAAIAAARAAAAELPLVKDPTPGGTDLLLDSGLTPPMAHAVKRRFAPAWRFISKYAREEVTEAERVLLELMIGGKNTYEHTIEELVDAEAFMGPWFANGGDNVTIVYEDGVVTDMYQMVPAPEGAPGRAASRDKDKAERTSHAPPKVVRPNNDGSFGMKIVAPTGIKSMPTSAAAGGAAARGRGAKAGVAASATAADAGGSDQGSVFAPIQLTVSVGAAGPGGRGRGARPGAAGPADAAGAAAAALPGSFMPGADMFPGDLVAGGIIPALDALGGPSTDDMYGGMPGMPGMPLHLGGDMDTLTAADLQMLAAGGSAAGTGVAGLADGFAAGTGDFDDFAMLMGGELLLEPEAGGAAAATGSAGVEAAVASAASGAGQPMELVEETQAPSALPVSASVPAAAAAPQAAEVAGAEETAAAGGLEAEPRAQEEAAAPEGAAEIEVAEPGVEEEQEPAESLEGASAAGGVNLDALVEARLASHPDGPRLVAEASAAAARAREAADALAKIRTQMDAATMAAMKLRWQRQLPAAEAAAADAAAKEAAAAAALAGLRAVVSEAVRAETQHH